MKPFVASLLACLFLLPACTSTAQVQEEEKGFVALFNGTDLEGWRRHDTVPADNVGGAWEAADGVLLGDQEPAGRGGFLITEERYADYVLRLETRLDYPVDSGVFLRMGDDGKSHQVTLDYRPGGEIGRIYLPWTQGLVFANPTGIETFKAEAWNDVEIRVEGEPARIRFWLNGELVTDFQHTEATTRGVPREGYIGLQVHPGEAHQAGKKVRFRNIRVKRL